ncbi:uroporphyrinogen-III C-methyltransferase [Halomonas cerina]|uniref:Uroporphyrin-3 C-methyltransferase n=1 Tax=Halomonas cerina TaxID=447424 RepID=A0A839V8C7_9GAMM|nr:uroporphyrinogen-III C-methyltransferase [Halomonas cerina]MBB3190240.1 uroporphyrin-3 C-methyltransferase [Halomonas cerina]
MSNQSNDQDEQQTPSGKAQGGADAEGAGGQSKADAGRSSGGASRRSRRRDKGRAASSGERPSSTSAIADSQASEAASGKVAGGQQTPGKPAAGGREAGDDKASPGAADKSSGTASSSSGDSKPSSTGGTGGRGGSTSGQGGRGGRGGKAGVVALVLVILLALGVALFGWQAWQRLQAQQQRLAALPDQVVDQSALGDLRQQLSSAESERRAAIDEAISSVRDDFTDYRESVNQTLDKVLDELSRQQQTDEREWLHAEAAYLLRLANQRLRLERDVQGAAALLRTADERLREADNPALMPVRREIASELAALEAVPNVDRTGVYLALNAQQEQLAGLPLAQDIEEMTAEEAALEEAPSGGWQQQLARFGEELKELVTVRQHDQALEALISPEQESYLRQSVRLVLEQAQLALLKEETELYQASLDKALTLIRGYYDTSSEGVQSVIARLEELKQKRIRPELPDISGSQQALASFIERRFESRGDGQGNGGQGDDA